MVFLSFSLFENMMRPIMLMFFLGVESQVKGQDNKSKINFKRLFQKKAI